MIFYLFRHGETDWNKEQRIQGSTDVPLNERGVEQAHSLIPLFKKLSPEIIYSSDLKRAYHTGEIVANSLGVPILKDERLREAFFGEAEGKTISEVKQLFQDDIWEKFKIFSTKNSSLKFPGGESRGDSVKRMRAVIEELVSSNQYQRVGIATHGGVVRNLLHSFLDPKTPALEVPNCVTYKLEHRNGSYEVDGPLK